jgi:hypothetical protein
LDNVGTVLLISLLIGQSISPFVGELRLGIAKVRGTHSDLQNHCILRRGSWSARSHGAMTANGLVAATPGSCGEAKVDRETLLRTI